VAQQAAFGEVAEQRSGQTAEHPLLEARKRALPSSSASA
jgi:hypothetical protein